MTDTNLNILPKALLVSADTGEFDAERSIKELEELARTAGAETVGIIIQKRPAPDPATCIGSGRLAEAAEEGKALEADLMIFDCELTANQTRNIEKITDIEIIRHAVAAVIIPLISNAEH